MAKESLSKKEVQGIQDAAKMDAKSIVVNGPITVDQLLEIAQSWKGDSPKKIVAKDDKAGGEVSVENIARIVAQVVQQSKPDSEIYGDGYKYVDEAHIDPDDYYAAGEIFWCHKHGYVIVDSSKNGVYIRIPNGKRHIEFKHFATQRVDSGKEVEIHPSARYVSYSKKEIRFLKEHPMYNTLFFSSLRTAKEISRGKSEMIAARITAMQKYGMAELIRQAQSLDVPHDHRTTAEYLRAEIARKVVDREWSKVKDDEKNRLAENQKHKELMKLS